MSSCKPVAFFTHCSTNTTYIDVTSKCKFLIWTTWVQLFWENLPAHTRLAWAASSEEAAAKIPLSGLFTPCLKDYFYLPKWVSKIHFTSSPTQCRLHTPPWHRRQSQPGAKHPCLLRCGSFCLGISAGSILAALCRRKTAQEQLIHKKH